MEQLKHLENRDLGNNCCPVMKTPLSNECCWLVKKFCLSALFFAFHSSFAEDSETQFSEKAVPIIKDGETQVAPRFKDSDMWIRHDLWFETELHNASAVLTNTPLRNSTPHHLYKINFHQTLHS